MNKKINAKITLLEKVSASGNSFLIQDLTHKNNTNLEIPTPSMPCSAEDLRTQNISEKAKEYIKSLCKKAKVDGFAQIIENANLKIDATWMFYNADGSYAAMCGNFVRCLAHYWFKKKSKKVLCFESPEGILQKSFLKGKTCFIEMPGVVSNKYINIDNREIHLLNTGVPHAVVCIEKKQEYDSLNSKTFIENNFFNSLRFINNTHHNVTLFCVVEKEIYGKTFERGLDAFSPSCGTGATAIAWLINNHPHLNLSLKSLLKDFLTQNPLVIRMPHGDIEVIQKQQRLWIGGIVKDEKKIFFN